MWKISFKSIADYFENNKFYKIDIYGEIFYQKKFKKFYAF